MNDWITDVATVVAAVAGVAGAWAALTALKNRKDDPPDPAGAPEQPGREPEGPGSWSRKVVKSVMVGALLGTVGAVLLPPEPPDPPARTLIEKVENRVRGLLDEQCELSRPQSGADIVSATCPGLANVRITVRLRRGLIGIMDLRERRFTAAAGLPGIVGHGVQCVSAGRGGGGQMRNLEKVFCYDLPRAGEYRVEVLARRQKAYLVATARTEAAALRASSFLTEHVIAPLSTEQQRSRTERGTGNFRR